MIEFLFVFIVGDIFITLTCLVAFITSRGGVARLSVFEINSLHALFNKK